MTARRSIDTLPGSGTGRDAPDFGRASGAPVESLNGDTCES
jgi:hypothetical protein